MAGLSYVAGVGLAVFWGYRAIVNRKRSANRLHWLSERKLLISFPELLKRGKEFTKIVRVDFGFGEEVWVADVRGIHDILHPTENIISKGFRLDPLPEEAELDNFCCKFGLVPVKIHNI